MTTKQRIFISICLVSFAGPFLSTAMTIAIPMMAAEFAVLPNTLSRIITIFLIVAAAFLLPFGKVSDIYGHRRVYTTALAAFGLSTGAAMFVPSLTWLVVCYVCQGLALAAIYVSYMPLLLTTTTAEHQGKRLGTAVALTYCGLTCGPVIGGMLTQFAGWRCIFGVTFLLIFASFLFIRPIKEEWYAKGAPFVNLVSSALVIPGIILCLYGLSINSPLLWLGLIFLGAFMIHESKSYHPLLPLYIFRNLTFSMSNLASFIQYSATYAVSFLVSLYGQLVLGLSPAEAGLLLLVQPLLMALFSTKAGDISDRYGSRYIASLGLLLTTLGLSLFAYTVTPSLILTVAILCIIGLGSALFGAPNNSAIMGSVKPAYHGLASSMLALARNLGQAISMALVTLILTQQTTLVSPYAAALTATLQQSFTLFAILCFVAIFASLTRGKV